MTWDLLYLIGLLLVLAIPPAIEATVAAPSFTPEELQIFASMRLCSHFGGSSAFCGQTCPYRYIRHRHGVPLCPSLNLECCIGPPTGALADEGDEPATNDLTSTTTTTTTALPQTPGSCGVMSRQGRRRKRIVGGHVSSAGRWSWLAALRSQLTGAHTCSGALIQDGWVVTAAHCFKYVSNPALWRVRLGEFDLLSEEAGERDMAIERIVLHPDYSATRTNNSSSIHLRYRHDIALIKLTEPANKEPICLPENSSSPSDDVTVRRRRTRSDEQDSGACWVAGWGDTRDSEVTDQHLREVTGEVHGSDVCGRMWGVQLENDMLCFGDGTYGPCAGDSGGPLSCEGPDGRFYLSGVVSWGTEDCNVSGYPSVFTNVTPYLAWINETVSRE